MKSLPPTWSGTSLPMKQKSRPSSGRNCRLALLLSLALAPLFIRSVMGLKGLRNTLNYGADRIRYLAPVPAGSKLRGRVTVAEAEDVPPDGLRVNYHLVIEIEGGKKPACIAELIALHYR